MSALNRISFQNNKSHSATLVGFFVHINQMLIPKYKLSGKDFLKKNNSNIGIPIKG